MTKEQPHLNSADTTLIVCPSCGKRAQVIAGVRLICPSCGLSHTRTHARKFGETGIGFERNGSLSDWFGQLKPMAASEENNNCDLCGNRIRIDGTPTVAGKRVVRMADQVTGTCETCEREQAISMVWVPYLPASAPRERTFGAALYLQEQTSKGNVYALNEEHAQTLLDYISSNLRNQQRPDNLKRMFALLPSWMKAAKNRPIIEKALKRLIEKAKV